MLPKQKRLRSSDFKAQETRPLYRGPFFEVRVAQGEALRFGCIISKKRIKRAVDRNAVRRKIYAAVSLEALTQPVFVFIYPTQAALRAPSARMREEIHKAFATLS